VTLPIVVSVPHDSVSTPKELESYCQLTAEQLARDSDEGAGKIYGEVIPHVRHLLATSVARAYVDLNRPPHDRSPDGVVKTHTIYNEPIYREPLPEDLIAELLKKYYDPYHEKLSSMAGKGLLFGVDCHTMAAEAPPIGPNPGTPRPEVCLGNVHGKTFPADWTEILFNALQTAFEGFRVTLNDPFAGGYITQSHGREMPWVQLEISRSGFLPRKETGRRVLTALTSACERISAH